MHYTPAIIPIVATAISQLIVRRKATKIVKEKIGPKSMLLC